MNKLLPQNIGYSSHLQLPNSFIKSDPEKMILFETNEPMLNFYGYISSSAAINDMKPLNYDAIPDLSVQNKMDATYARKDQINVNDAYFPAALLAWRFYQGEHNGYKPQLSYYNQHIQFGLLEKFRRFVPQEHTQDVAFLFFRSYLAGSFYDAKANYGEHYYHPQRINEEPDILQAKHDICDSMQRRDLIYVQSYLSEIEDARPDCRINLYQLAGDELSRMCHLSCQEAYFHRHYLNIEKPS